MLRSALTSIDRVSSALARFFAFIACMILICMMGLTVVAVAMRKLFESPILGVNDLDQMSMILLIFLGMAYCGLVGGHIAVDLIAGFVGRKALLGLDVIVGLTGGIFLLFVSWYTVDRSLDAMNQNEATNMLFVQLYPFYLVIAGGLVLYSIVLLVQASKAAMKLAGSR